jgi:hypothetical protein
VLRTVWNLADDYHWRVRRAAGYALHDLWAIDRLGTSRHKARVLSGLASASWRQKYSLCAALTGVDLHRPCEDADAIDLLARDQNRQVRWGVANYLDRYVHVTAHPVEARLACDEDAWVRSRVVQALTTRADDGDKKARKMLAELASDDSSRVRVAVARELRLVSDPDWVRSVLEDHAADTPAVAFAAAYTLRTFDANSFVGKFGHDQRAFLLRERVARRELDPAHARFASTERYILRRTEFVPREDSFMRLIDAMATTIALSVAELADEERAVFMRLLLDDPDEAVRWALVTHVVAEGSWSAGTADSALGTLRALAQDPHWWVRREVALGLRVFKGLPIGENARVILEELIAAEGELAEDCGDEVLHFAHDSLAVFDD